MRLIETVVIESENQDRQKPVFYCLYVGTGPNIKKHRQTAVLNL